jgi:hypothetical protein
MDLLWVDPERRGVVELILEPEYFPVSFKEVRIVWPR